MTSVDNNPSDSSTSWVEGYTANYRYRNSWLILIFPIMSLVPVYLVWSEGHSVEAAAVAIVAALSAVMAYFEHRTYCIQIMGNAITRSSCFHSKSFPLSDIDLIQMDGRGARGSMNMYIRRERRILLKIYWYLDGFEDLAGFMRSYAHIHHVAFKTRDRFSDWA